MHNAIVVATVATRTAFSRAEFVPTITTIGRMSQIIREAISTQETLSTADLFLDLRDNGTEKLDAEIMVACCPHLGMSC